VTGGAGPGRDRFARAWAEAITGTSYVPLSVAEVEEHLRGLTDLLTHALFSEPFAPAPSAQVGAALVAAHFTGTDALGRTVAVLGEGLLAHLGIDTPELRVRLAGLQGALAAGYAQALQERTLDEQEEIRRAALVALNQAEDARRTSDARFQAVFAAADVGIGIGDMEGRILEANDALVDMLGYSPHELRRRNVTDFLHPDDAPGVWRTYLELISGERDDFRMEKRFFRKNADPVWTQLTVSVIRDGGGRPRYQVAMLQDVTDLHRLQTRLRHQALHDPLTRLPNRALFSERLAEVFGAAAPDDRVGLCFLDLDGFKVVNDSLGHDVGDQLLQAVATRLDVCVSRLGHLVARLGGDEFVILVTESAGADDVIEVADRILAALTRPVRIGGHELSVSASIGLVEGPVAKTSAADLMRAADITLYWAKSDGRGRWALFDPQRDAREVARYTLSATMPAALERQEFTLDYQPLLGLAHGEVVGVEALVRWQHPEFGLLHPAEFLGLAEETGLIVPLGRWVLERACRQARMWQDLFPGAPFVSVNLAARQSQDLLLVADVKRILDETGLEPDRLQLELTEGAVLDAVGRPSSALWDLSEMGVRIALDDFGTGYANLAYLRSLPVRELKLAGSFVEGLRTPVGSDPVDEMILATLVSLAHLLGLTVTAEGVEDATQVERLRLMGCDAAQGRFFARPGPPEQIIHLLARAAA
jgi:diguanylate cyclase (GGDEF)-like protein/PAS domain S-box-containing protein